MDVDRLLALAAEGQGAGANSRRITAVFGPDGRRFWIKRVERHGIRGRMTKGSARRSFENDRTGLRALARAGVPVAPIIAEGADFFVTPDLGPTLREMLVDPDVGSRGRTAAFAAAGAALARLHRRGLCHGRPALRDTCWDGTTARFIDLERFSQHRTGPAAFAADLLIFLWSGYSTGLDCVDELDTMAAAYLAAAPVGTRKALLLWVRRLGWLGPALTILRRVRPMSLELAAVARTLDHARDLLACGTR